MSIAALETPTEYTEEAVYSNFNHELNRSVVQELTARPGELCAQHAAWNFCGSVWQLPDGRWVDQVWRYHAIVDHIYGDSVEAVIEEANDTYGAA
ncbi:hypothetical protein IU449_27130 [Nocardia higoensis]|uniref:Uncharacterized protein n=1 Tax=Nocardia higoensis TaxID=228599 RepID=A0ABS0DJ62_9NOCA|nr:hypothetical protein [Nocardia higoensis]MBF6358175.1 hypothetical protein [Nocardia higoensis]